MPSGHRNEIVFNEDRTKRLCPHCSSFKDLAEFELQKHKWYRQMCKACKNIATVKHRIKSKFGLTVIDYQKMLEEQNYVCAICQKEETGRASTIDRARALSVDHNHKTGQIRRLLCSKCNTALGLVNEDPYLAESLAAYIRSYR